MIQFKPFNVLPDLQELLNSVPLAPAATRHEPAGLT